MTRPCKEEALLSELLDGELPEKKAMEIRSHLALCERCQQVFSDLTQLNSMLKSLPSIELSDNFDKSFDRRLRSAPFFYYRRILDFISALLQSGPGFRTRLAVSAALILIIAMVILNPLSPEPTLEERFIAENLDFFDTMDMIDQLDLFTNWDVIDEMDGNT